MKWVKCVHVRDKFVNCASSVCQVRVKWVSSVSIVCQKCQVCVKWVSSVSSVSQVGVKVYHLCQVCCK